MKTTLLLCFIFLTFNLSFGTTHVINWTFGYHGTTNIMIGDTVQWDFVGFHNVISDGSPTFTSSANQNGGSYSITFNTLGDYHYLCSIHGAGNMDGNIVVSPLLGVDDVEFRNTFYVYPNPLTDVLNLELPVNSVTVNVDIYNIVGKNVYSSIDVMSNQIDVSNLKNGLYFITVNFDDYRITKKIIKK